MLLKQLIDVLDLEVLSYPQGLDREVSCGYVSDMLSSVMANAPERAVWVTVLVHANILAVAVLRSIAAIILVLDRKPEPDVLKKAEKEKIVMLASKKSAFEIVGKLYEVGIRGENK